jgi:antirestriction protein
MEGELQPPRNRQPEAQLSQPAESTDEQIIRQGIAAALRHGTEIDDRTARYIASQLHEGQASALYSLASSGAIAEEVHAELTRGFEQQSDQVKWWINWLGTYCLHREDKEPVPGWAESAAAIDRADEEAAEAQARQELMQRISAAGTTTLGNMATVLSGESTTEGDGDSLAEDAFSWTDAAHWQPDQAAPAGSTGGSEHDRDRLDELFGEVPDEVIGTVEDVGWFGLLRHEGRPGGIVLSQNGYGFRGVWETDSDNELTARWDELQTEHDAYVEATRAYNHEPGDRDEDNEREDHEETQSGHHPEIWVGSLSDYTNGRLHGVWLDATLEPDELHAAVAFMLRNSYMSDAEEWAIMDYDDFCGLDLGEYQPLDVISRVAKGIAQHGEAFARWVEYVGERNEEALSRFEDHFLGKFESMEAYVEQVLDETGFNRNLDEALAVLPEDLREYISIDVEQLASEWGMYLHEVEASGGGVLIFDPRM